MDIKWDKAHFWSSFRPHTVVIRGRRLAAQDDLTFLGVSAITGGTPEILKAHHLGVEGFAGGSPHSGLPRSAEGPQMGAVEATRRPDLSLWIVGVVMGYGNRLQDRCRCPQDGQGHATCLRRDDEGRMTWHVWSMSGAKLWVHKAEGRLGPINSLGRPPTCGTVGVSAARTPGFAG